MAEHATAERDRTATAPGPLTTTQVLRVVVLGLLLIGVLVVLRPFLTAVMWAVVLCLSTWPIYARLAETLRGRRTLAALLMTLGTILVLLAPFLVIGISLADDVRYFTNATQRLLESPPADPPGWVERLPLIGPQASEAWREIASDSAQLTARLRRFIEPATASLLRASVHLVSGLVELAMSIFIGFFLFRDGPVAVSRLTAAIQQIVGEEARQLIDLAGSTVRGVVYGILGTALVQSIIAGIGFAIAGVPGPGLLALMTFFLSVTPVGAPLIWIPAAIWLFAKGAVGWGIFMIVWGLLISSVDNVIKPMIVSQGSRLPFILIFLGVLGGAAAFGFIGLFLGPTLLAVGFRLLEQWNAGRTGSGNATSAQSNAPVAGSVTEARSAENEVSSKNEMPG